MDRLHTNVRISQHSRMASSPCLDCLQRTRCPVFDSPCATGLSPRAHSNLPKRSARMGEIVCRPGERFSDLYMVRSGFFKSYSVDVHGVVQVSGFYFPGEIFGIESMHGGVHHDTVEALETASYCRIPMGDSEPHWQHMAASAELPLHTLLRIMGKIVARDRAMIFSLGKMCARRRFAAFLLDISTRMHDSGFSGHEFRLCMTRIDIANYLCLAIETVSRLFTQFQSLGILKVSRRQLSIINKAALSAIVAGDNSDSAASLVSLVPTGRPVWN